MVIWVGDIVRPVAQGRECEVAQRELGRKGQGSVPRGRQEIIFWADNF